MNLVVRLLVLLYIFVQWTYYIIRSFLSKEEEAKSVPPSDNPILKLSATQLGEKIRERKVYSQEILQTYKRRIQEVNPIINAVVEDRFEIALKEAREADRFIDENRHKLQELQETKPFFGIPITIKESIAVKGLSYTGGSLSRKNIKADKDSLVVQRLKEAGLIPLLVSNTPEYCSSIETYNKIIGYTCNPYNTQYTSGGSSGGEGALLGSAASLVGIGSDLAGSIRAPAAFNGVFGHKPSTNIVPIEGHWPMSTDEFYLSYLTIGPMTRYAEDLKPLLKIMAGTKAQELKLDEEVDLKKIQIFYMEDTGNNFCLPDTEKEVRTAVKAATAYLSRECHCHVSNRKFKELQESIEIIGTNIMRIKKFPSPLNDTDVKYNVCLEILKSLLGKSKFTLHELLFDLTISTNKCLTFGRKKYIQKLEELKQVLEDALGDTGVLIYPCTPSSAFRLGGYFQGLPNCSYLAIPNLLGLPATAIPVGFDAKKLPVGIQISSEEIVLAYIKRVEEVNPIINAVVENRFSEALLEARKVDEYLKRFNADSLDLAKTKPLLGVPITVKECLGVKDMSFTCCALTRRGIKADKDGEAVALLREAGAIILLVSSTPEYCNTIETTNKIIGRTRNPYNTTRVCGGSSGGEGALLGAGASVVGIGSDIAGSIRVPCAFNGIYGHKPSAGVVSIIGSIPWCNDPKLADYLVIGPMTRYVEDLKLTLKVLAGSKASKLGLDEKVIDLQNVNLFYMVDSYNEYCLTKVDKSIKRALKEAVAYLSKNFKCQVNETKFPEMGSIMEMTGLVFRLEGEPLVFTDSETKYNVGAEFLKFLTGSSIFTFSSFVFAALSKQKFLISDEEYSSYLRKLSDFKEKFTSILGNNGVLLYPSFPTEAFKHNGFLKGMLGTRFPAVCNLLGCPATCVPIGLNKNGLPLGIQVIGAPYRDNLTLEVARELGRYFGGWQAPN